MKVLVIHAHPNPASFSHELRRTVERALVTSRAEVRVHDLYAEHFEPCLSIDEHRSHLDPPSADSPLNTHFADLLWCDAIVLVYPTWWGGPPAMLKGWFDRVLVRDVAWDLPHGARRLRPRLHNVRRLIVVTTHGSSRLTNALQGSPGRRLVLRSVRAMCHPLCRTKWIALFSVDADSNQRRSAFLDRVDRGLRRLNQ